MTSTSLPLLATVLAALLAGSALAGDTPPDAAAEKELAQAHEALAQAAARVAELSREQGTVRARVAQARNRPLIGVLLA
ncbi:MAG TPA: hypothetical protein PK743_13750, partial [Luteimonas sp.]|nr:hypothetical protein [Luteimonas sp.]